MPQPPPAASGARLAEVDTPALVIDLDAFERNLQRMADFVRKAGVRLRPHAKTHKSPDHRRQADRARRRRRVLPEGVGGRGDGGGRHRRRAGLQRGGGRAPSSTGWPRWRSRAKIGVCVDDADNVAEIEAAAAKAGARLDVLVEIDVGGRRCGVAPGAPAARIAERIAGSPASALCRPAGLSRLGPARARGAPSASAHIARAVEHVQETLRGTEGGRAAGRDHRAAPAPAPTRTRRRAASTPSCRPAPTSSWTPTMPATSAPTAAPFDTFEHALFVYATVMSAPVPERRVVDAGLQGAGRRQRHADALAACRAPSITGPPTSTASSTSSACSVRPGAGRQGAAGARPLRSDRQPARLVRRRARTWHAARRASKACGRWRRAARCSDFVRARCAE